MSHMLYTAQHMFSYRWRCIPRSLYYYFELLYTNVLVQFSIQHSFVCHLFNVTSYPVHIIYPEVILLILNMH